MNTANVETIKPISVAQKLQLRPAIQGTVITPDDPQYDEARQAWNLSVDQHPAMIVIADSVEDVVGAVQYAVQAGLSLTVQGTGHGVVRPADDSLLLITSKMKTVRVDEAAQTAWVEAGVKWGEVLEKAQAVGLAPLLGSSPDVGVVGYTLGGGMGWLGRKYGLATDSVRFFEVVTADGRLLHARETENSDLFWGLRGGGGSFGIITGMEIKLYPVSTVYGGNLFYPISLAKEVYARYRNWIASAPDELTSSIVIMNFPPIPEIPDFLRGQSFVIVRGLYSGPIEEGEALIQSWRDWQTPYLDGFRVMPFSEVGKVSDEPLNPTPVHSTGAWLNELSDEVIDILLRYVTPEAGPSPLVFAEVRHVGGAVARVSPEASAYGNRDASFLLHMLGVTPTPEAYRQTAQYAGQIKEQLRPYLTGGVYMNFLEGEESQRRVESGYSPEAYRRLVALKAAYDPDNRLRSGFNIQSAG